MSSFDIDDISGMFACGVHYGHRARYANAEMAEYVFSQKNDMQIIDITKTAERLSQALEFVHQVVRGGGKVVVVGTKPAAQLLVREYSEGMLMPFVDQRWLGGTLTNFKTIRSSVSRLEQLDKRFKSGSLEGLTKKERLILQRERAKLSINLGGIQDLDSLPEVLFVIDVAQERIAIKEANKLGIPVIGIVDTNCSPEGVDYLIPGNDDALSAIQYYLECLSTVVKAAASEYNMDQEKIALRNKPVIKKTVSVKEIIKEEAGETDLVKKTVKKVVKKVEVSEEEPKKKVVKKVAETKKVVKKITKVVKDQPEVSDDLVKKVVAKKVVAKKVVAKKPAAKKPAAKKAVAKKAETPNTETAAKE